MGIFDKPKPWSIAQTVDHWQWQASDNPLWSDEERKVLAAIVALIEGKCKADAIVALREYQSHHNGMSDEAGFARMTIRRLKEGV